MAALVRRYGVDVAALGLLRRRSQSVRLIAITALGHLQEKRAWRRLRRLSLAPGPVTSLTAARAMLRIAPERALEALAVPIAEREDWPLARLGAIFKELGADIVTPALVRMLSSPTRGTPPRLMQLARFGHRDRMTALVRQRMRTSDDVALIVPALDYVEDQRDVPWARAAASHAEWRVRIAAASALGRIGGMADVRVLTQLLGDPVWRVRYQAAQALAGLHGMSRERLELLRSEARDGFAADMLARTLAHMGPA
jgi:HEAT repeat protein